MKQIDYLIVGQGLAGTWLSYFLLKKGKKVLVVDHYNPSSASNVASGIINPVTGRRLVKSWKIDTLLPFAEQMYRALETELNTDFYHPTPIIWLLNSIKDLNFFSGKATEPGYEQFFKAVKAGVFKKGLQAHKGYAAITGSVLVDTQILLAAYRLFLLKKDALLDTQLRYEDLHLNEHGVQWQDFQAKKIIFCEGYRAMTNPFFKTLPFVPAKGTMLLVEIEGLELLGQMLKGKVFVVPVRSQGSAIRGQEEEDGRNQGSGVRSQKSEVRSEKEEDGRSQKEKEQSNNQTIQQSNHLFWIGSTYDWDDISETPNEAHKKMLIHKLQKVIDLPFTIIEQKAGIRPTVKDRRPFVGLHPEFSQIGIFNGLGTKGVSLAPYFAHQFVELLVSNGVLNGEVNIQRFWNKS